MPSRNNIFSHPAKEIKVAENQTPHIEQNVYTTLKDAKVTATNIPDYDKAWPLHDIPYREIRAAIPDHCFQRDTLTSLYYLAHDVFLAVVVVFAAVKAMSALESTPWCSVTIPLVWILYWVAIGIVGTGLWTLAHECGHGAFSTHKWLNSTVGMIIHSIEYFPYFSFRITHAQHHKNNGSMMDCSYVPRTRSQRQADKTEMDGELETPLFNAFGVFKMCLFGFPMYWIINYSGPYGDKNPSHFNPNSGLFRPGQYWDVIISNIGIFVVSMSMFWAIYTYSFLSVFNYYIMPVLIVNGWMVAITYLHHTSPYIPRYREKVWNFQRGAAITIDRSYGKVLDYFFHHLTDTHVAHHFFPALPHYHAVEATKHIKRVLGKHYCYDDTPIWESLMTSRRHCWLVEDTGDVAFYKRK